MRDLIDASARALRADCPAFTRRNLMYAVRRTVGERIAEEEFDAALDARLLAGTLEGLLPARCDWGPRRLPREWDAYFPAAIVLVDRGPVLDLLVASGIIAQARLAVVSIDGAPPSIVAWLKRGFRRQRLAPIVYLHDAGTVVYTFAFEPLATLAKVCREPLAYRDLGLPPLGRRAQDFPGASLSPDEAILELEALPPAALVRYAAREALRMVPGDPNMLPLGCRSEERERKESA